MMFAAFLVAGLLLDSSATSSSSQAQASVPLREIVYNFSDDESTEYTTDQSPQDQNGFGGGVVQSTSTGLAAPPESSRRTSGFRGTMTVDVLEVDSTGFLKAEVKENTDAENGAKPFDATFIVRPDGELVKLSGSDDADMTSLMRYFGTSYFADRSLVEGQQWSTDMTYGKTEFQTDTTVTATSGDNVSINPHRKR